MRLTELHRPRTLLDIIGQPCVRKHLMPLVKRPKASCWLLAGAGGSCPELCIPSLLEGEAYLTYWRAIGIAAKAI